VCAVLGLAAAAACKESRPWPPRPASVHLGEDTCATCRMIVSEERFGAQVQDRSGRVSHFDDLGCLLEHARKGPVELEGAFVRDLRSGSWVAGPRAFILRSDALRSPMGSGLAALATREEGQAEAARHRGAKLMRLSDLWGKKEADWGARGPTARRSR
jgi:copper chaperone NosL